MNKKIAVAGTGYVGLNLAIYWLRIMVSTQAWVHNIKNRIEACAETYLDKLFIIKKLLFYNGNLVFLLSGFCPR